MPKVHQLTLKFHLEDAKRLADKDGTLPRPYILIANGYWSLYRYILRHPKEFKRFHFATGV